MVCRVTMSPMIQSKESKPCFLITFLIATNYLPLNRLSELILPREFQIPTPDVRHPKKLETFLVQDSSPPLIQVAITTGFEPPNSLDHFYTSRA